MNYLSKMHALLGVDESYDDELKILIMASRQYLNNAGCTEPTSENDAWFDLYCFAMMCNIKITFDENVNTQTFIEMRDTTIENLRSSYAY